MGVYFNGQKRQLIIVQCSFDYCCAYHFVYKSTPKALIQGGCSGQPQSARIYFVLVQWQNLGFWFQRWQFKSVRRSHAHVTQMDSVVGFYPTCCGFESCRGHHLYLTRSHGVMVSQHPAKVSQFKTSIGSNPIGSALNVFYKLERKIFLWLYLKKGDLLLI